MSYRSGENYYDTLQICKNGHPVTFYADSQPGNKKNRCPKCGEETITNCLSCNAKIQGHHHIPNVLSFAKQDPPSFCHECGASYPWTKTATSVEKKKSEVRGIETSKIFLVHGHDEEMKQYVARIVSQIGLDPVILHEQPNQGKTIIEKFEANADVGFAIILLSSDDMAYSAKSLPESARPRARQNVIVELGYFVGRLGRNRVFVLKRGDNLDIPSDFSGVIYTPYDEHGKWKFELAKELRAAGYTVDANALL